MHFSTILTTLALAALSSSTPMTTAQIVGDPVLLSASGSEETNELSQRAVRKHPYVFAVLQSHNTHRANHSAAALSWDSTMAGNAATLAQRCVWHHDTSIGGQAYGQNLAAGWARNDIGAAITNGWYGELPAYASQYGKATPDTDSFAAYGHFTQLVWKDSTSVGCSTFDCSAKGGLIDASTGKPMSGITVFTVCNYSPPGNYLGEFATNVARPRGLPAFVPKPF